MLWTWLLLAGLAAAAGLPSSQLTSFPNLPSNIFFFDDSTDAVFVDSVDGTVFVSSDEGKTWADAGIEGVQTVVEHPFDRNYAFAIGRGTTHYRTADRGRSWQRFSSPAAPALISKPLAFHVDQPGHVLFQVTHCEPRKIGWGVVCRDETYYTTDAFSTEMRFMRADTSRCAFAHSTKEFKHDAHRDLVFCVAFDADAVAGAHAIESSRLFASTDFFENDVRIEDLGIGKAAKGVLALAIVSKFAVVALRDITHADTRLYVSTDAQNWAHAEFPQSSSALLKENAYTIVESTLHSLAVDVVRGDNDGATGTLFVSNSNGTYFVESLADTNRNSAGYVDYEHIYGVDGVGLANVVANADQAGTPGVTKRLRTMITFDDGRRWSPIRAPEGSNCDTRDIENCALHLHSVTTPHNFGRVFSSPAPGYVMAVGSVGPALAPYEDSDTYLSSDAGLTWTRIAEGAHKYEFGDAGSLLVLIDDEEATSEVKWSGDGGRTWETYDFGQRLRARALVTVPDSTSRKFLVLGEDQSDKKVGPYVVQWLDFADTRDRKCGDNDFEKWYARSGETECLLGHKQWYRRRKPNADCYVGEKFNEPVEHDEPCECGESDYECDYNFVRQGADCVPVGPEPVPAGTCTTGRPDETYRGSSGYRKIPGDICEGGIAKDAPVEKQCSQAEPAEGAVVHQTFEFPAVVAQHAYFKDSPTILVRLTDHTIWQSANEGYTWTQLFPEERFLGFYHHKYTGDRAYLVTPNARFYYTTDAGRNWYPQEAPNPPNTFRAQVLRFHPTSDYLIWVGNKDCEGQGEKCRAVASYSRDNGRRWTTIDEYVQNCAWARDARLAADPNEILCESFRDKKGSQRMFGGENPLELVVGGNYYTKKRRMFEHVVGFAKFSEYLVVAAMDPKSRSLQLQVSLDGANFAEGRFPPSMHPETHAYTVLESSTNSLFLHMTMSEPPSPYWGNILKSNSNGTYFGVSAEHVNRDERGYVDFEKASCRRTLRAVLTGHKALQSRITHNDGGTWKPLNPPPVDSFGNKYECQSTNCALHIHGYTERLDPRATYSSPSIVGLLMAVGNVGEHLLPYTESDTFLSRDAGFTWEEVHKDAHLWEFGDSGSVLVMANDEEPTDHVLFSTNEGKSWREYKFVEGGKLRVRQIVTVPSDTSRRFILIAHGPRETNSYAIHLDFSALTKKQCVLSIEDPGHDDFELWSPSEERTERCLFGRQTLYHRRVRDTNCVVGKQPKAEERVQKNCLCTASDFECEFNYMRNDAGECVLVPGTQPLPDDDSVCRAGDEYWYERTAYRKIPYSSCEGGERPDRGLRHICPGFRAHGALFWMSIIVLPFAFTALIAYWFYKRSGMMRGTIRLPGDGRGLSAPSFGNDSSVLDTLASVPWFIIGITGIAYEWAASRVEGFFDGYRSRRGYRNVPIDEDAQILRFEDED
uniref:Vacuolar protein sorting/targeting protein 10 n=1 Tax=Schizophyllum commune (strain H4-8 / FGSC 9210) TaxID=578458 RepID=D8Q2A4_SCHCM